MGFCFGARGTNLHGFWCSGKGFEKSPGLDGSPIEAYKLLWGIVDSFVLNSKSDAFDYGKLADLHRTSVITPIVKIGDMVEQKIQTYKFIS